MIITEYLRMQDAPYVLRLLLECSFWVLSLLVVLTSVFYALSSITHIYLNYIVPIALKYRLTILRIQSFFLPQKKTLFVPKILSSSEILTPSDLFDTNDPVPPISQRISTSRPKKKSSKKPSTKKTIAKS
jgi:hypothetical protein